MDNCKSVLVIAPADRKFRLNVKSDTLQSDLELINISFGEICRKDFALRQLVDSSDIHFIFKKYDPLFKCEVEVTDKDVIEHGSVLHVTIISSILADINTVPTTSPAKNPIDEQLPNTNGDIVPVLETQESTSKSSLNIESTSRNMYLIESFIIGCLPTLSNSTIKSAIKILFENGIRSFADLKKINPEKDLSGVLKTIHARKLKRAIDTASKRETPKMVMDIKCTDSCNQLFNSVDIGMKDESEHRTPKQIPFPIPYKLPTFPLQVMRALNSNTKEDVAKTPRLRNLIVSSIVDDLLRYGDGYFSSKEYAEVCSVLISKYPQLADKRLDASVFPYATWLDSIRGRIRYVRHKILIPTKAMKEVRKKYGNKNKKKTQKIITLAVRKQSGFMRKVGGLVEDEKSIKKYKTVIKKEFNKVKPNMSLIDDGMKQTINDRTPMYNGPVLDVLQEYPVLKDCRQLLQECHRLLDINITANRETFMSDKKKRQVLYDRISVSSKSKEILSLVEGDEYTDALLLLLPILFKESLEEWVLIDENIGNIVYPVLRLSSGDGSILNPEKCDIFVDKQVVSSCHHSSIGIGLDAVLAASYLWNLDFNPKLQKTFRFLAEVVCGFPTEKSLPISIIRLYNTLC